MHLVFSGKHKKDKYTTVTYYSVIAVFLQANNVRNMHGKWKKLYNNIPYVYNEGKMVTGIKLSDYLPSRNKEYYLYI